MQVFVGRPVMALALNIVLLIVGLLAFKQIPLRHKPFTQINEITIKARYPGAAVGVIEQRITKPLEDSILGIDGIKRIEASSKDDMGVLYVTFHEGANYRKVVSQIRDALQGVQGKLPKDAATPRIHEESNNNQAIMYIGCTDQTRTSAQIYDYLRRNVVDKLKMVDGVASIEQFGTRPFIVDVRLDPARLKQHGITINQIREVIERQQTFATGGEIDGIAVKKPIVISAPLNDVNEFSHIPITKKAGQILRLKDVADIQVTAKDALFSMAVNNSEIVAFGIIPKPRANPLDVARGIYAVLPNIKQNLPTSMQLNVNYDATEAFKIGIESVFSALWEALVLVGVIVTLSLASVRASLIPMITIPLCLMSTFTLIWLFDFSINPVTLLALVLAVGLVVDDAIVVVENIYKHMQSGSSALEAAKRGMKEITFAVVVMTVTLAAVYLPLAFQTNETAVMFREFALTLAGSVVISGFVALTLTPAMCGKMLNPASLSTNKVERIWDNIGQFYAKRLEFLIQYSKTVLGFGILVGLLGVWGYSRLPEELEPLEDENIISGSINHDNQLSQSVRQNWGVQLNALLNKLVPEKRDVFVGQWGEWDWWFMTLKERQLRNASLPDIMHRLHGPLAEFPGPQVTVNNRSRGVSSNAPISINLRYAGEFSTFITAVRGLIEKIRALPEVDHVRSNELREKTRVKVHVDRELAALMQVQVSGIEQVLTTFFSGVEGNDFTFDGYDYKTLIRTSVRDRRELAGINRFFVTSATGEQIPLETLVTVEETLEPVALNRIDRLRSITLQVQNTPSVSLDAALQAIQGLFGAHLPVGILVDYQGDAKEFMQARQQQMVTFALALAFVFLVLAALFESLTDPFMVLLTVPLSIVGAVIVVDLSGGSNNIYMQIGMVTLIGLITKHGILIIDFANRLQAEGQGLKQAIMTAATQRLRPIIMTTLAMVCGAVPLLFSLGPGAAARLHIGWVIVGGMLSGTLFSLIVIPTVYYTVKQATQRLMAGSLYRDGAHPLPRL